MSEESGEAFSGQAGFPPKQRRAQMWGIARLRQLLMGGASSEIVRGSGSLQTRWSYDESSSATLLCDVPPLDVQRTLSWPADAARGTRDNIPPVTFPWSQHSAPHAFSAQCWRSRDARVGQFFGFSWARPPLGASATVCGSVGFQFDPSHLRCEFDVIWETGSSTSTQPATVSRAGTCAICTLPRAARLSAVRWFATKEWKGAFQACQGVRVT